MKITRRDLLKYCATAAGALGLSQSGLLKLEKALAKTGEPPIIWMEGASDTGCAVSFLNKVSNADGPDPVTLLTQTISLDYHPTVMAAAGDLAVASANHTYNNRAGEYFLAIEGCIPLGENGKYCTVWEEGGQPVTMIAALERLAERAAGIIAVGTCASYGGVCGASPNPTGAVGIKEALAGKNPPPIINVPGCPVHPDWLVGTIATVLTTGIPPLDSKGRPVKYFGQVVHDNCQRFPQRPHAVVLGQETGCLRKLGCRGYLTAGDCAVRGWNNGTSWCQKANNPCHGCTEPGFPDQMQPFYKFK
jgi:hydrogenase small subunit